MTPRRGTYGIDAPYVPAFMLLGASPLLVWAVSGLLQGNLVDAALKGASGLFLVFCAGTYLYTTRAGKFVVWDELLESLALRGDEQVLDVGCGRGAVLLLAAQRLPQGKATGIDLWSTADQSGNGLEVTRANAAAEGVAERVELHTGDMRQLPFADGTFDVIVSSLAIHNVPDAAGRVKAVQEIARVVKPGGFVMLADFKYVPDYTQALRDAGLRTVQTRSLGLRFWYGGPWAATHLVTARR
jgi:ubiquinone/menaquinone biosynthesis C-methylase UbiE